MKKGRLIILFITSQQNHNKMKTIIRLSFAFALLFSLQTSYAQITISPKVGLNVSAIDAQLGDLDAEARTGWHAGLDFRVGDGILFLNPGIQYHSYTARLMSNINQDTRIDFTEETTIQSVKIPLNLGLRITGDNGLIGLHVKGGIVPTYVMGIKEVNNFDFNVDDLSRLTWGTNIGVGIDFLFMTADLSYEKGLTDYFADVEGKNNVLLLSVGLKF